MNYPGYELANFLNELQWDYTYNQPPYFRVIDQAVKNLDTFLDAYDSPVTAQLKKQIQLGSILQNIYWLMIGVLSLQFTQQSIGIDLLAYIKIRY